MTEKNKIQTVKEYLVKQVSPYVIYLFGSYAAGNERIDSDIDLAFLSDQSFSEYNLFMISQGLANLLDRNVDLIDLKEASTVFQAQVIGTGKVIYNEDDTQRLIFEMKVLKMYAKLNEERENIIKQIKESGFVYGE